MKLTLGITGLCAILLLATAPTGYAQEDAAQETESLTSIEHWGGFIDIPMLKLGYTLAFTTGVDDSTTGTIDIPMQGVDGMPITDITYTDTSVSFAISAVGAVCTLTRSGDTAEGTLAQMGQTFPTTLTRYGSAVEALGAIQPNRPQLPKPPFPYENREVRVENEISGVSLAGTLSVPPSREMHPAVILISGSGPQDRDETIADHKPFAVIADHLTRQGIAVLRFDDRGVGGSTGSTMDSTVLDTQTDVEAWLTWLKEQPGIDPKRIGLVGHSEGGAVAPLVAAGEMKDDVSFVVLLAGMALPGDEVVIGQTRALFERTGFPEQQLNVLTKKQRTLIDALKNDTPEDTLRALLGSLIDAQNIATPLNETQRTAAIDGQIRLVGSPWYRHLMTYDPGAALRGVSCPMLAINGSLDVQVLPDEHLTAIDEAAADSGNTEVETVQLEGLNHLLQRAESGLPAEYGVLTETIDPEVLDLVTMWIRKRTGVTE